MHSMRGALTSRTLILTFVSIAILCLVHEDLHSVVCDGQSIGYNNSPSSWQPIVLTFLVTRDCLNTYDTSNSYWTNTTLNNSARSWMWMVYVALLVAPISYLDAI